MYKRQGLSYDLEEDAYTYQDDKKQTTMIDFNVNYPVISGLKAVSYTHLDVYKRQVYLCNHQEAPPGRGRGPGIFLQNGGRI